MHPQWIVDSIAAGSSSEASALPPDAYILPSGASVLHPFFVFRKKVRRFLALVADLKITLTSTLLCGYAHYIIGSQQRNS